MIKEKRKPSIRFPGFEEDWEQRKLDEMVSFYTGLTYKPEDVKESGTLVLRSSNVKNDSIIDADNVYVSNEIANSEQVQIGDIIVVVRNGSRDLIGKHALVLEEMPNTVIGAFMTGIRSDQPGFINALLSTSGFQDEINKNMGSTIHQITGYMFANMKFAFPSIEEQKQIGTFFNTIDETITLHQQKLDDLKELKSGLLQKMFPQKGEKVPQVRFTGFTGDWEQRKLKDLTERVTGNDGRMDLPTLTISAANGWMDQRDRFSGNIAGKEQKNYTLLSKGMLSYNHGNSKLAAYGTVFVLEDYEEALVPRVYHSFKTNDLADAKYLEILFASKIPDQELRKLITSGARMDGLLNISYDEFENIRIPIPQIEEQLKISNFFRKVDETITLHQQKIDDLNQLKNGLLQKMFP